MKKKTERRTKAEQKRLERERHVAMGFKRMEFWVHPSWVVPLKMYLVKLRKGMQ